MDLAAGGHLTHGAPVNFSGKWIKPVSYGVRVEDGLIDYEVVEKLASLGAVPVGDTPEDFARFCRAESELYGRLVREARISASFSASARDRSR
jgi:hypothetical protein